MAVARGRLADAIEQVCVSHATVETSQYPQVDACQSEAWNSIQLRIASLKQENAQRMTALSRVLTGLVKGNSIGADAFHATPVRNTNLAGVQDLGKLIHRHSLPDRKGATQRFFFQTRADQVSGSAHLSQATLAARGDFVTLERSGSSSQIATLLMLWIQSFKRNVHLAGVGKASFSKMPSEAATNSGYKSRNATVTPLVQPNPSCNGYSPPPPGPGS